MCHGSGKAMESDKCEAWGWMTWGELRAVPEKGEKLFLPLVNLFKDYPNIETLAE